MAASFVDTPPAAVAASPSMREMGRKRRIIYCLVKRLFWKTGDLMSLPYDKNKILKAKELRKNMTPQEKKLWYQYLSKYHARFQRQKTISGFIADFFCAKAHLIIEVDGSQHRTASGIAYDKDRTDVFRKYNLDVLRVINEDIELHFQDICRDIDEVVQKRMIEINRKSQTAQSASPIKNDIGTNSLPPS